MTDPLHSPAPAAAPGPPYPDPTRSQINVKGVFLFAVVLSVFTLVIMGILAVVIRSQFVAREKELALRQPRRYADQTDQFPGAVLQGNPAADTARMKVEDGIALSTYGWDAKTGVGRIPIDRALEIVAEKGLPTRPAAPPAP